MLNENVLHGAWRAGGLLSSPRPDGSGITFVCPKGCEPRLSIACEGVCCSICAFSASGEPWEIAKAACAAQSAPAREDDDGLPIRSLQEILDYIPDPSEEIWPGGLLTMGLPTAIVGAPGVGKSRITLQAAICTVLGLPFIDFPTHGPGLKWLFLQTENSMRRLQSDLRRMTRQFSVEQRKKLSECIRFLDIGAKDFGSICMNDGHADKLAIQETLRVFRADVCVIDPLRDAGAGDMNKDADMTATCKGIMATLRAINPRCTPLVVHHGRTGTLESAKVFGGDAGSFARNSKVLLGWLRSQINVAAAGDEWPDVVIFGCGKCSDGPRWDAFAAKLDTETMLYDRIEFDLNEWGESMKEQSKKGKGVTKRLFTVDDLFAVLDAEWLTGAAWFGRCEGIAQATFYRLRALCVTHPRIEWDSTKKFCRRKAD